MPLLDGFPRISERPRVAPDDYRSMPPFEKLRRSRTDAWAGSGVPIGQHPGGAPLDHDPACAACGSIDTLCIAMEVTADLVEKDTEYELVCAACGKYSHYAYWS